MTATSPTLRRPPPCLRIPARPSTACEIKSWLDRGRNEHRAILAKAVVALANHGGGYIVLRLEQDDDAGEYREACGRPANLETAYGQDTVYGIATSYSEPPVHCEVHIPADYRSPSCASRAGAGQQRHEGA